ncbi:MAG: protein kinase [Candidatus Competibacter denitrificans]
MSFVPSKPGPNLASTSQAGVESTTSRLRGPLIIPGYEIESEIGRGGMATVYRAVQQSLGRQVAIKVLAYDLVDDDPEFAQRFKKEGHILAQLLHPNIVTIFDIGESEGNQLFLSIEYLAGGTLKEKIHQGLPFDATIRIARAIASALGLAHVRGVIHRDVKPSNIMFRHDGTPVLTDFGVARVVESKTIHTMAGLAIGSPGYMSPEQAMGERASVQSDLYSLGVVIYEMLVGHVLYEGGNPIAVALRHVNEPIPKLPRAYANLQPILNKLLAKKPSDRYRNADEFLRALNVVVPTETGQTSTDLSNISITEFASGKIRSLAGKRPRLTLWIPGILLLVVTTLIYGLKFNHRSSTTQPASETTKNYEHEARRYLANGELQKSLDQIAQGLAAIPGDIRLIELKQEVERRTTEAKALNMRQELQQQAQLQAEQSLAQAQKSLREGKVDASLAHIEQGLLVMPDYPVLLALREQVRGQLAEQQRQVEIARQQAAIVERQKAEQERQQAETTRRLQEVQQYWSQALQSQKVGNYVEGLQHIGKGLALDPNHIELNRLREVLSAQLVAEQKRRDEQVRQQEEVARRQAEEARRQAEIAAQQKAERARLAEETAQRRREQALWQTEEAERRKAEKIDQQRAAARRLEEAKQHLMGALEDQRNGKYASSLERIDKGLVLAPAQGELVRLREKVSAQLAAEQKKQVEQAKQEEEIKAWLAKAEAHWKAKRLTEPAENSAEAAYRQILKLDEGNRQAQEGLQRIAGEYVRQAQQQRSKGALQEALQLVDKGLKVLPTHSDLARLQKEIHAQLAATEQQKPQQQQQIEQRQVQEKQRQEQAQQEIEKEEAQKRQQEQQRHQEQEKQRQEQQRKDQLRQEQQRKLEQQQRLEERQRQEQQYREQQRQEQQHQEEKQRQEEKQQEQRQRQLQFEKQKQEQRRKEQIWREQQRQEVRQEQQRLEQRRLAEKQRRERQRRLEQRQEQQHQEEPPKAQQPETTNKPRVFGTF